MMNDEIEENGWKNHYIQKWVVIERIEAVEVTVDWYECIMDSREGDTRIA